MRHLLLLICLFFNTASAQIKVSELNTNILSSKLVAQTFYPTMTAYLVDGDNYVTIHKFALHDTCGITEEDIWSTTGVRTEISTPTLLEVVSASTADTSAGTGARTIRLFGLDANGDLQEEDITMNGTSVVPSTKIFSSLYRAKVLTAGSGQTNAGNITIRIVSAGATQATILVGTSSTFLSHFKVPRGMKAFLIRATFSANRNSDFDVKLIRVVNGVRVIVDHLQILDQEASIPYEGGIVFNAGELFKLTCQRTVSTSSIHVSYDLILVRL